VWAVGGVWRGTISNYAQAARIARCCGALFIAVLGLTIAVLATSYYFAFSPTPVPPSSIPLVLAEAFAVLGPPLWLMVGLSRLAALIVLVIAGLAALPLAVLAFLTLRDLPYSLTHTDDVSIFVDITGISDLLLAGLWAFTATFSWRAFRATLALRQFRSQGAVAGVADAVE